VLDDAEILSDPDRIKYIYSTDYELSTYLVFFATALYNTWNETYFHSSGAMPVNFYVTPDEDNTTNRELWNKCVEMLEVFGEIYGPYPFIEERYGIYYFGFGGGMEHQTLTGQGGFGESLTAHELGHQWWGDMVTCRTWQDIWLNEGFASYSEALWEENQSGGSADDLRNYMDNVLAPFDSSDSVFVPEESLEEVGRIFSYATTYQKAAWVVHMLRGVMGDELFFNMITEYRARYEYGAADTEQFRAICEEIYGSDLEWFFRPVDLWNGGSELSVKLDAGHLWRRRLPADHAGTVSIDRAWRLHHAP
jgi:aminopeptidase N